ncbi:FmdB family zinc ribbon protein [bacterium]
MRIFEYECRNCGSRFDFKQNYGEKPKKRCPDCRGKMNRSLFVAKLHIVHFDASPVRGPLLSPA